MTSFCTIASGSSGNASLLSCGSTHLLIDMGISCRRVLTALKAMGLSAEELSAILITHEHTDHIGGLATYLKKYSTPLLCTPGTARQLHRRLAGAAPLLRPAPLGQVQTLGELSITPLATSHDCAESAAYRVDTPDGTLAYLTDTGFICQETADALLGSELLVLESNHDIETLRSGPYPYHLKQRVLGPLGHLSNDVAAQFAADSARSGTRDIILAHLSEENNTPQMALNTVGRLLEAAGYTGQLTVAPRSTPSEIHRLERVRCSE